MTTIEAMLAWLTNGTRNALVLLVLLAATVAAIIGATHHAPVAAEAAEGAVLLEVIHAPAASPESVAEPAHSPADTPMAGEAPVGGAIVLGCALFVLCCVALLLRRLRVAREAAVVAGGAGVRGPTVVGPFVAAPSLPPSLRLLSISRT